MKFGNTEVDFLGQKINRSLRNSTLSGIISASAMIFSSIGLVVLFISIVEKDEIITSLNQNQSELINQDQLKFRDQRNKIDSLKERIKVREDSITILKSQLSTIYKQLDWNETKYDTLLWQQYVRMERKKDSLEEVISIGQKRNLNKELDDISRINDRSAVSSVIGFSSNQKSLSIIEEEINNISIPEQSQVIRTLEIKKNDLNNYYYDLYKYSFVVSTNSQSWANSNWARENQCVILYGGQEFFSENEVPDGIYIKGDVLSKDSIEYEIHIWPIAFQGDIDTFQFRYGDYQIFFKMIY